MNESNNRIDPFDLIRGVLIKFNEKGIGKFDEEGLFKTPLGLDTEKKLSKAYFKASKIFPQEMDDYGFLLRTNPYCHKLRETIHLLQVSGNVRWLDNGISFIDKQFALELLNSQDIPNYEKVSEIADFIVDNSGLTKRLD